MEKRIQPGDKRAPRNLTTGDLTKAGELGKKALEKRTVRKPTAQKKTASAKKAQKPKKSPSKYSFPKDQFSEKMKKVNDYSDAAEFYVARGDHKSAIANLTKAIKAYPPGSFRDRVSIERYCGYLCGLYCKRAESYDALGNYKKAISDLSSSIRIELKTIYNFRNFGNRHLEAGNYEAALLYYSKGLEREPWNARYHAKYSIIYTKTGKHGDAIAELDKAIELAPYVAGYYLSRAELYDSIGKYPEAIADLAKCKGLGLNSAYNLCIFGDRHLEAGNYEAAVEYYNKAIELQPRYQEAYSGRAKAQWAMGAGHRIAALKDLFNSLVV